MYVWKFNPYYSFSRVDINSPVVTVTVFNATHHEIPLKDLNTPIQVHLMHHDGSGKMFTPHFDCQFWDKAKGSWSTTGCKMTRVIRVNSTDLETVCECNHLTDFSLGRQYSSMFADPAYEYIAPWEGFNNFSFGLVKSKNFSILLTNSCFYCHILHILYNFSIFMGKSPRFKRQNAFRIGVIS